MTEARAQGDSLHQGAGENSTGLTVSGPVRRDVPAKTSEAGILGIWCALVTAFLVWAVYPSSYPGWKSAGFLHLLWFGGPLIVFAVSGWALLSGRPSRLLMARAILVHFIISLIGPPILLAISLFNPATCCSSSSED